MSSFYKRAELDPTTGRTRVERLEKHRVGPSVWPRVQDVLEQGADPEEVAAGILKATEQSATNVANELRRRAPKMLREHRRRARAMQRRIRAIWGPAFDTYYQVYVCAEEFGSDLQQLHQHEDDDLVEALLGLHARTCLLLFEVHSLISRGLPFAAWARARSLHETAVVSSLLGMYGRNPEFRDLAERYLRHAVVDQAEDLRLAVDNGLEVDQEIADAVQSAKAELIEKYGPMFGREYGWARVLFPHLSKKQPVRFVDLEALAQTGLSRLDYRRGSHHVHASAWTIELNRIVRRGVDYRLTGPTNLGFVEPAAVALESALQETWAVALAIRTTIEPMDLLAVETMRVLYRRASDLLVEAEGIVLARESRLNRLANAE